MWRVRFLGVIALLVAPSVAVGQGRDGVTISERRTGSVFPHTPGGDTSNVNGREVDPDRSTLHDDHVLKDGRSPADTAKWPRDYLRFGVERLNLTAEGAVHDAHAASSSSVEAERWVRAKTTYTTTADHCANPHVSGRQHIFTTVNFSVRGTIEDQGVGHIGQASVSVHAETNDVAGNVHKFLVTLNHGAEVSVSGSRAARCPARGAWLPANMVPRSVTTEWVGPVTGTFPIVTEHVRYNKARIWMIVQAKRRSGDARYDTSGRLLLQHFHSHNVVVVRSRLSGCFEPEPAPGNPGPPPPTPLEAD